MLTGQRALGIFKAPSSHNPKLGPEVDAVILRGLQELPKDRFASVLDFASALEASLKDFPIGPEEKKERGLTWPLVVGPVLLLLAGAWFMRPGPPPGGPGDWPPPHARHRQPEIEKLEPPTPEKPVTPEPTKRSEEFRALTELRSQRIWEGQGRPKDQSKEKQDANWFEAERQVEEEIARRAHHIWEKDGKLTGPEGEARREINWTRAEKELLDEARQALARKPK